MRKFLLPILLLIFSCEEVLESIKEGCTTTTACNYDAEAMKDDGSCVAPEGCNHLEILNYIARMPMCV